MLAARGAAHDKQIKPPSKTRKLGVARHKAAGTCRNAPPLRRRHGIGARLVVVAKFNFDENQNPAAAQDKVNLTQRVAKVFRQQTISFGKQRPARLGLGPAPVFEGALSAAAQGITYLAALSVFGLSHVGFSSFY